MPYVIGILLALGVALFARASRFDADQAFYPTVLMVIASYYGLFAVMGGSARSLISESMVIVLFLLVAWIGFKMSAWWVVAGLFSHGVLDFFHGRFIANPGVPPWWPMFCLAYDITAAAFLAWLLLQKKGRAHRPAR